MRDALPSSCKSISRVKQIGTPGGTLKPSLGGSVEGQSESALETNEAMEVEPSLVLPNRVEQGDEAPSPVKKDAEGGAEKNMASCGTLGVRTRNDEDDGWQPPNVTHDFTYPSDEEIVPNPKANFRTTLLPRLDHVRSWFKGAEAATKSNASTSQEGARSNAPCLPVTTGNNTKPVRGRKYDWDISPVRYRYTDMASRLPRDQADIKQVAGRPGIGTRLKHMALQGVEKTTARAEEPLEAHSDEEEASDAASSSSLEKLPTSPPYNDLDGSIPSEDDDYLKIFTPRQPIWRWMTSTKTLRLQRRQNSRSKKVLSMNLLVVQEMECHLKDH